MQLQMNTQKNYISHTFYVTAGVIVVLLAVSAIPKTKVWGLPLKRADIMSDIRLKEKPAAEIVFEKELAAESPVMPAAENPSPQQQASSTVVSYQAPVNSPFPDTSGSVVLAANTLPPAVPLTQGLVQIEDFGVESPEMDRFYRALASSASRPVRIAVLGDSFIEGDIITADLRERFQENYGGRGIGFVPFSSNLPPNRATVKQTFSGLTNISIMNKRSIPREAEGRFFVSGLLLRPGEGAVSTLEGTTFRKFLRGVPSLSLLFTNSGHTAIDVVINDTIVHTFHPEPSDRVQKITVDGNINSVKTTFSGGEGFWGYGMVLSSHKGVMVDNYSIRGNAGYALYQTGREVNRSINDLLGGYDLVILQYGQNVVNPEQLYYDTYAQSLAKIAEYVRSCFPGSSILIMSVGDRSSRDEGELETMPAIAGMLKAQRKAAELSGAAFWNTYEGMGGYNSMLKFVEKNWAAKDYTHIGYSGGRHIAAELFKALQYGKENYDLRNRSYYDR